MERHGVKFVRGTVPYNIVAEGNQKRVFWKINNTEYNELYDTVMLAIGRSSDT